LWISFLQLVQFHWFHHGRFNLRDLIQETAKIALPPSSSVGTGAGKPSGVFVVKVQHAHEALQSLCILDKFFNHGPQYAIRIFADEPPTSNATLYELYNINPLVDLQLIVDEEQNYKKLPPELSESERAEIQGNCTVNECTTRRVRMGYVYMGYWRYRHMAYHDSLQGFEYFISWDTDAYLTQPLEHDPFQILHHNNLTGFFVTDFHSAQYDQGIEEAANRVFGNSTQGRGYLNSPDTFPFFNDGGRYSHRSFYGYLYGGRLDFFRSPEFREYSRLMVPYTYRYRVDEQVVIAMAWSMLAPDRVWHFPSRGYSLSVYHHSFLDDKQLVDCDKAPPPEGATVYNHTDLSFCYWINPMLPGVHPVTFQYPGYFWFDWVDYSKLIRSLLLLPGNDEDSKMASGFADCLCLPTKDSPPMWLAICSSK
jgi:hypothetical protein